MPGSSISKQMKFSCNLRTQNVKTNIFRSKDVQILVETRYTKYAYPKESLISSLTVEIIFTVAD